MTTSSLPAVVSRRTGQGRRARGDQYTLPPAKEVLSQAQSGRAVVQEFVPLAESLEWQLGQTYLKERGNKAFISDASPVPFVVNNDGSLSRNAAEILFASLVEEEVHPQISQITQMEEVGIPAPVVRGEAAVHGSFVGPGENTKDIWVLELGIGVGLFARLFLDHFRDLCLKHGKDYYDRLCYIAADKSERMLMDVARHGVLAGHAGHYRLRLVDALQPDKELPYDACFLRGEGRGTGGERRETRDESVPRCATVSGPWHGQETVPQRACRPFRAVFLNYLLDCLPAAVLELDGDSIKQLYVQTCAARHVNLSEFTDMSLEQMQERAKRGAKGEGRETSELLEVYGLFASEYDYRPVDYKKLPYGEFTVEFARRPVSPVFAEPAADAGAMTNRNGASPAAPVERPRRVLLSYGAIQSLEKLLNLVADDGFILVNDYGQTQVTRDDEFEHQRFSLATFVGLNFPLLKAYFEQKKATTDDTDDTNKAVTASQAPLTTHASQLSWLEPSQEAEGIHSRLLGKNVSPAVRDTFERCFSKAAQEKIQEPLLKARQCVKVGRFELAAACYNDALELQPRNWVLLNEIAMFLTFSLRDPKAGINMARLALELNPTCSSDLWCTLGDGLFEFGRYAEARSAYLRALKVNESDVRARFNLAFVHTREKNYPAALDLIAQALALDKTGEYRERLLQKQQEVLQLVTVRHQQEYLRMINLVSKYASKPTTKGTKSTKHGEEHAPADTIETARHREEG